QRLELAEPRVQPERGRAAAAGREREQVRPREGEAARVDGAARRRVGAVAGLVERDDGVVAVVPAEEEDADERSVVAGLGGGGAAGADAGQGGGGADRAQPLEKFSAGDSHGHSSTWACGEVATRYTAIRTRPTASVAATLVTASTIAWRTSADSAPCAKRRASRSTSLPGSAASPVKAARGAVRPA